MQFCICGVLLRGPGPSDRMSLATRYPNRPPFLSVADEHMQVARTLSIRRQRRPQCQDSCTRRIRCVPGHARAASSSSTQDACRLYGLQRRLALLRGTQQERCVAQRCIRRRRTGTMRPGRPGAGAFNEGPLMADSSAPQIHGFQTAAPQRSSGRPARSRNLREPSGCSAC